MPLLTVLRNCNLYPAVAFTAQEKATPIKWSKRKLIKGKRSHCYDYSKKNKTKNAVESLQTWIISKEGITGSPP